MIEVSAAALILTGGVFFLAGTVGLLRFPDIYCRLHALTKADNLGLGFVVLGLALLEPSWAARLQMLLTWLLVLVAAATVSHLLARTSLRRGIAPLLAGSDPVSAPEPGRGPGSGGDAGKEGR